MKGAAPPVSSDSKNLEYEAWLAANPLLTPEDVLKSGRVLLFEFHQVIEEAKATGDLRARISALIGMFAPLKDLFAKAFKLIESQPTTVNYVTQINAEFKNYAMQHLAWLQRWIDSGEELPEPPVRVLRP